MAAAAICAELIKKCVGAHPCVRPGRKPLFSCSKSVWQDSAAGRTRGFAPTTKRKPCTFFKSDLRGSAFSDAATAAAVGSPRFWRLIGRKNHSRVINSNSDISTNAFSDAALAWVHLTMTLSKAALKYLKFGERWCIMECEYCLEGREWH